MSHNPVNHPARPIYRAIVGLIGLYLVIFGVLGLVQSSGASLFARSDTEVLGQGANLGYSLLSAVLGVIILVAIVLGRNIDVRVNTVLGYGFMVLGLAELAVLRTDANYLNFTDVTCIVTMIVGLVLLMAGMYGRRGSEEEAHASQKARLFL
jgi:Domain of unknown function (DUF4383)